MPRHVHVIGAGLAGLSAAIRLTAQGVPVTVYEATRQAGGRCRSYDDAITGMHIDNGTHLLLSGNHAAISYLQAIGVSPDFASADFDFIDGATGQRWTLRLGNGRFPAWIFDSRRRVPGTGLTDYLSLMPLAYSSADRPLGDVIDTDTILYKRLLEPLMLAALNIEPPHGSSQLASTIARETLLRGGQACRPLVFEEGLSSAFVAPALDVLQSRGAAIRFETELHKMTFAPDRIAALSFGSETTPLNEGEAVILAVPAAAAPNLVPGLTAPDAFRAIVNLHYDFAPPAGTTFMTGAINTEAEWIFAFRRRISVTISAADRLLKEPRDDIAARIWREISGILGIDAPLPVWQLVRERRATFSATPEQNKKRPGAGTRWPNLFIAGDWTDTGLPATIEGAIRSGARAADLALQS